MMCNGAGALTLLPFNRASRTVLQRRIILFPISKFTSTQVDKMLGADISFLPELEARGMKFSDNGELMRRMPYKSWQIMDLIMCG